WKEIFLPALVKPNNDSRIIDVREDRFSSAIGSIDECDNSILPDKAAGTSLVEASAEIYRGPNDHPMNIYPIGNQNGSIMKINFTPPRWCYYGRYLAFTDQKSHPIKNLTTWIWR